MPCSTAELRWLLEYYKIFCSFCQSLTFELIRIEDEKVKNLIKEEGEKTKELKNKFLEKVPEKTGEFEKDR